MIDDLENGWLANTPDAAWNLTEDVPEWLEEFRATCENLGIERYDPTTRAEAESELRDMARDVLSGLMEVGSLPVYVVMIKKESGEHVRVVYLHESMAKSMVRVMNEAAMVVECWIEKHEVM